MKKFIPFFFLVFLLTGCSTPAPEQIPIPQEVLKEITTSTITEENNIATEQEIEPSTTEEIQKKEIPEIDNKTIEEFQPKIDQPPFENDENLALKTTTTPPISDESQEEVSILKVNGELYSTPFSENTSVYQLMQNLSAMSAKQFYFETKNYAGIGKFVTSINGLKENPQDKMYWIYYINGKPAQIGISDYIIQKGDLIEWKYEKAKF